MNSGQISLIRPDDWHLHLRDGEALGTSVPHSARNFARAIVMPNLQPPVTSVAQARAYRERIIAAIPVGVAFEPLLTLYLTDALPSAELERAAASDFVKAVKYYPAGATTNSAQGVSKVEKVYPLLERMEELDLPLLVHGEVTAPEVDPFDREQRFIETVLEPLTTAFPALRLVLEHITTADAVGFVTEQGANVAATITIHHLLYNRSDLFAGGLRPHLYCLPLLKRRVHQQALADAALSGNPKFFLGTDSAPHGRRAKESDCGCAGIYSAPAALELYAEFFAAHEALDRLEAFAGFFGADFYRLPRNRERLILRRESWTVPQRYTFADDEVVPLRAGQPVHWRVVSSS